MDYDKIRSVRDNQTNELLIFDIFLTEGVLYIVCSVFVDMNVQATRVDSPKATKPIPIQKVFLYTNYEPFGLIQYEKLTELEPGREYTFTVDITRDNHTSTNETHEYTLPNKVFPVKKTLIHSTLLRDDYKCFGRFYVWYSFQGVEEFYIYYNGLITGEIKTYFQDFPNTKLIEWNYPYWFSTMHYAQPAQIHHCLYKYAKPSSDWLCLCDMDEYLRYEQGILLNLIRGSLSDCFYFQNYWAEADWSSLNALELPKEIWTTPEPLPRLQRSKMILKTSKIEALYIHWVREPKVSFQIHTSCKMYHFYSLVQKHRKRHDCILKRQF